MTELLTENRESEQELQYGGDWLTRSHLAERLNRSYNWVTARTPEKPGWCENRLDDRGKVGLHFRPEVLEVLQQISDHEKTLDERDFVTADDVAMWMGLETDAAMYFIQAVGIHPIERYVQGRGSTETYYPAIFDVLKNLEKKAIANTINTQMTVGSLEARIRAKQQIVDEYITQGLPNHSDVLIASARIEYLKEQLIDATTALIKLEDEVDPITVYQPSYM